MAGTTKHTFEIATDAHAGQSRFDGSPYICHPMRVRRIVQSLGHSSYNQQLALLRDTVEDSAWTLDMLADEGFSDEVLVPLDLLTKRPDDTDYDLYIDRLMTNARARAVKKADLFDNIDLTGLANPTRKRIETIEKYRHALVRLSRFPLPRV